MVWHDHWGEAYPKSRWLYRLGTMRTDAIIAVNNELAAWARDALRFPAERVHFVRNFVALPEAGGTPDLPPSSGRRITVVANVRPQKDLGNLVAATAILAKNFPDIQVLVAGNKDDAAYLEEVEASIRRHGLEECLILLGARGDVTDILAHSDIGVLSSESEGLPLSLIEYGMAGLAVVATQVGQCAEVLGDGRYGILVPPGDPESLAEGIASLLRSDSRREMFGREFQRVAIEEWGPDRNINQVAEIYKSVLTAAPGKKYEPHRDTGKG